MNETKPIPQAIKSYYIEWGHAESVTQGQYPTWFEECTSSKMWQKLLVVPDDEWDELSIVPTGTETFLGTRAIRNIEYNVWFHEDDICNGIYIAQPNKG